jgi:hypothetical protein
MNVLSGKLRIAKLAEPIRWGTGISDVRDFMTVAYKLVSLVVMRSIFLDVLHRLDEAL